MPVYVEPFGCGLDVLPDLEVELERALQLGLMLFVVRSQRGERLRREGAKPLDVGTFVDEAICAELVVERDVTGAEEPSSDR